MLRTIDRYVIRESIVPTLLGLLVFTFILQIQPVMEVAERLIANGVAWSTVGRIMLTLLPQALGITIPMAVLVGLLVALGRLSADREAAALQACGISLYRLVVPVGVVAGLAWAATSWVLVYALPAANQAYREIVYSIVAARAENEVRPRVFFEDFPNWSRSVHYLRNKEFIDPHRLEMCSLIELQNIQLFHYSVIMGTTLVPWHSGHAWYL